MGIDTEIATKELKVPYVATASDGFTAENLAYYKALFNGMNTVYIHLQNLLFIVVGGFFLATLGGGKIQKYLENRGQSQKTKSLIYTNSLFRYFVQVCFICPSQAVNFAL